MTFPDTATTAVRSGALDAMTSATRYSTVAGMLADVVPAFDQSSDAARYNVEAWAALRRYAAARLAQTSIPSCVVDKHAKLANALKTILPCHGPTRGQFLNAYPGMAGCVMLLDRCLENLPEILCGRIDALAVMFPKGSFALVEPIYCDNPIAGYFNRIVADIVQNFADQRGDRPIRVLEIGAGTGGTTQSVLPVLIDRKARYTFSDISLAFLNKARGRFADYPFIAYELFDIEKRGPDEEPYDVVIAANVMHATADLPAALANARSRVAPGGIFVLDELTAGHHFLTLTFGLTEGWWLSRDVYRITNGPLVTGETWRSLLLGAGFVDTRHHGASDHQVIAACV
jgi:polyketide synthase PksM